MEYPIRILHVVRYLEQGGIQNLLMNLYRNIDRKKFQFDFLVCGEGTFDNEVKKLGGRVYKMKYITEIGEKKYQKELMDFLNKHKEYKIIHSHLNQVSGAVMQASKRANVPIRIAHSHSTTNSNNILQKLYKRHLQNRINRNATDLIACSKEAAKWLFRKQADNAIILNNAIDMDKFTFSLENREHIRKELKIKEECVVLGNVGRFVEVKNQRYLLKIFREYNNNNKNSYLILIGEGNLEKAIKSDIKKMKLENYVKMIKPTQYIEKYYSAFDYFVFPSKYEGLGIVLIEAQITGLKCFASNEVIPKTTKISENIKYIDLNETPKKWAEKIPISNSYIEQRKNMKIRDENYDIKKVVKQLEQFYETKIKTGVEK